MCIHTNVVDRPVTFFVFFFLCFFEEKKGRESRQKKTWNKGENQEQAPPILMVIWTDLYEPTYTIPNAPQI